MAGRRAFHLATAARHAAANSIMVGTFVMTLAPRPVARQGNREVVDKVAGRTAAAVAAHSVLDRAFASNLPRHGHGNRAGGRKDCDIQPFEVAAARRPSDVAVCDSSLRAGVCLTVTALTGRGVRADVSSETLRVSTARQCGSGHLEKSLAVATVSAAASWRACRWRWRSEPLRARHPRGELRRKSALHPRKGSICIDGVSLT